MASSLELLSLQESRALSQLSILRSPAWWDTALAVLAGAQSSPALQRGSTAGYCGHYFPRAQAQVKGRQDRKEGTLYPPLHC